MPTDGGFDNAAGAHDWDGGFSNNAFDPDTGLLKTKNTKAAADVSSAADPLGDIFKSLADAEVRAAEIMAEATAKAAHEIRKGQEAAAKATIESAEIAAAAVLEQAQIADDRVREFWKEAKSVLMPIIKEGRYAADEMADMLAIKRADGSRVDFDLEKLRSKPGYEFQFTEGNRALQNSAVGTALSGENTKATIAFGQGLASNYFQQHYENLGVLAQGGWNAARDMANAATQTGNTFANVHTSAGSDLGQIYSQRGSDLSQIYTGAGNTLGQIYADYGANRASLITGLASTGASISIAELNRQATLEAAEKSARSSRSNSIFGALGTIGGAVFGGPAGAALGGLFA